MKRAAALFLVAWMVAGCAVRIGSSHFVLGDAKITKTVTKGGTFSAPFVRLLSGIGSIFGGAAPQPTPAPEESE